jgi:hypothetical protein
MFFFMHFCGGKWYAEHETDITAARQCKKAALIAQGGDGDLVTYRAWFQRLQKGNGD